VKVKNHLKYVVLPFILVMLVIFLIGTSTINAYSPHDVESTVRNNWNKTYGYKSNNKRSGTNIVYDVYLNKYFNGGYRIINKNFGKGTQPYINFRGWAINFGYKRHTSSNHDTYIVAQNTSTREVKIYKTDHLNLSATEDVEYNNQGPGVYNECPASATKKDNQLDCNMRYDSVGFDAYLPLNDLFPDITKSYTYNLFLVKKVDNHIVYTQLILPFDFDKHSYQGGEIDLTSGVNANKLRMIGYDVIRRTGPRSGDPGWENRYFVKDKVYTRVATDETQTTIWYGVNDNGTHWASSVYWQFGGDQAQLKFIPDNKPPDHISHSMTYTYKDGNNYFVQPNTDVKITLRQKDPESGNYAQNLRLYGNSVDVRSQHQFVSSDVNHNNHWQKNNNILISSAKRLENTSYGKVEWNVIPKTHGHSYDIQYYYEDKAKNSIGYNSTGMKLRVDGKAPTINSAEIKNAQYVNGNDYWVQPNHSVNITFRQYDPDSGNKEQNIRLAGSGTEVRSNHDFHQSSSTHNNHWIKSDHLIINSAKRLENTSYGKVEWNVIPKTHGHSYDVQYWFRDNVNNETNGYIDTDKNIRVDGQAPTVIYRNPQDTNSFMNRPWSTDIVEVRLKYSDPDSGYKRSRYAWTQSPKAPKEDEWSSWTTIDNYVVTQSKPGRWYLHTQMEDNVGNVRNIVNGEYQILNIETNIEHIQEWIDYYNQEQMDLGTFLAGEPFVVKVKADPDVKNVKVTFNFPQATKEVPEQFLYDPMDNPYPNFAHTFELETNDNLHWTITDAWRKYWIMIPDGNYSVKIDVILNDGHIESKTYPITIYGHIFYNKKEGYGL
jgi:hypothetical protein